MLKKLLDKKNRTYVLISGIVVIVLVIVGCAYFLSEVVFNACTAGPFFVFNFFICR